MTARRAARRDSSMPAPRLVRGRRRPFDAHVPPPPPPAPPSPRLAAARADLARGLEMVAKHAPELALETSALVAALDVTGGRRGSPLRWEWLASTGVMLEGNPGRRLLSECAALADRILHDLELHAEPGDESVRRAAIRVHLLAARTTPLGLPL